RNQHEAIHPACSSCPHPSPINAPNPTPNNPPPLSPPLPAQGPRPYRQSTTSLGWSSCTPEPRVAKSVLTQYRQNRGLLPPRSLATPSIPVMNAVSPRPRESSLNPCGC